MAFITVVENVVQNIIMIRKEKINLLLIEKSKRKRFVYIAKNTGIMKKIFGINMIRFGQLTFNPITKGAGK